VEIWRARHGHAIAAILVRVLVVHDGEHAIRMFACHPRSPPGQGGAPSLEKFAHPGDKRTEV
jgi:hypothetical protein